MSLLFRFGRVPEKTTESNIVLVYAHIDLTLILVTFDCHNQVLLPSVWITVLLYLKLSLASGFKVDSVVPALAPEMHLTIVPGVANFRFLKMVLPIIAVGF